MGRRIFREKLKKVKWGDFVEIYLLLFELYKENQENYLHSNQRLISLKAEEKISEEIAIQLFNENLKNYEKTRELIQKLVEEVKT